MVNLGMAWKKPSVGHDLVYILKKSSFYAISSYVGVNVSLRGAIVLCSVSRFITPKGLAIHPTIIDYYFAPAILRNRLCETSAPRTLSSTEILFYHCFNGSIFKLCYAPFCPLFLSSTHANLVFFRFVFCFVLFRNIAEFFLFR